MNNYTSFLVCFHSGHTDLYINGLPLGIIKSNNVELAKFNPLNMAPNSQFKNLSELRAELNSALDKIESELNKYDNH